MDENMQINPIDGYRSVTKVLPIDTEIELVININRTPKIIKNRLKFAFDDGQIYFLKKGNKHHIQYIYYRRRDVIKIDHFSLWLIMDCLNIDKTKDICNKLLNIDIDDTATILIE